MRVRRAGCRRLRRVRSARRADDGLVTAELAVCLPVLVAVLAMCLAVVSVVAERVRVQDAATEAARAVARGDPSAAARLVSQLAPGATLTVSRAGSLDVAVVRIDVRPLGGSVGSYTVTGRGVAPDESTSSPTVGTSPGSGGGNGGGKGGGKGGGNGNDQPTDVRG